MRLLHARHDHDRARAVDRRARLRRRPGTRGAVGKHLPLHGLYLHRRGGARRAQRLSQAGRRSRMRNSFVGAAVERREDLRFLRGRGEYVDDLAPRGLLHAVILRSAVAHGRLRAIDFSAALRIPGVHAVITAKDMPGGPPIIPMRLQPLPDFKPFEQPVIAADKVRYVGEPIAVEIDTLPPITDRAGATRGDSLLFEATTGNIALTFRAERGDAAAAFRDAPYRRR